MKRKHIWITGTALLSLCIIVGIVGYWTELTAAINGRRAPRSTTAAPGTYSGPLYAASEKIGDSPLVLTKLLQHMKRNDIRWAVLYFMLEGEDEDVEFIKKVLQKAPGKIIPFFSTGMGGEDEGEHAGPELVRMYAEGHAMVEEELGAGIMKGIGEVEIYDWDMPHDDKRVLQLLDFAAENKLAVMFHPLPGKKKEVEVILSKYPHTTFLIHMFPEDFARDRQVVIDLLSSYANVYFTVDLDHMLFDAKQGTGLLYKYENSPLKQAVSAFKTDFDKQRTQLMQTALGRYQPLIAAHPDRVIWGTEMNLDYTFDKDVYDRMIGFVRQFIGSLPKDVQEKVAYKNAQRVFGKGVTMKQR